MADNAAELQKLARGFQASAVLFALAELDLATALADFPGGVSVSDLAAHLNLQERQLGALLDVAVAQGLLASNRQSDGGILYGNNDLSAAYLSRTGGNYVGNQLKSYHEQYAGWGNLAQAVRSGQNVLPDLQSAELDRAALRRVLLGLHNSGKNILPKLLPFLESALASARRVLDVGCGTGVYSLALAEKYPALQATLLDKPDVLGMAQQLAADSAVLSRVTFQAGNYLETDFSTLGTFDVVLFFQVLRTEAPENIVRLLTNAHKALAPGGYVLIYDTWLAENRVVPLENVYQNLTMSMMYRQGGIFSTPELQNWLAASGFGTPQVQLVESIRPMVLYSVQKAAPASAVFVVVGKAPVAGKVKTRLCPPLSYEAAARLYTGFLRDTLELVQNDLTDTAVRIVCPSQADADGIAAIVPDVEFVVQSGEGLTAALSEAFASCLDAGFGKVFCLSSDNPTLPTAYLEEAVAALDDYDLVLGPSEDGGYYLIGAKKSYPALFENMIWSTDKVLDETITRAQAAGLSYYLLPLWYDLDTGADLTRFVESLQNEPPNRARHTRQALQENEAAL